MKPKAIIIRTAGTNCDWETQKALEFSGADAERIHVNQLINKKIKLFDYQILVIPGGFSYGDDIASGKILANEIKCKLGNEIKAFALSGKPILGICNGFQILVKMGLLPDPENIVQTTTLTFNDSDKFECRWINLKKEKTQCIWTKTLPEIIPLPVAHGEGKFIAADKKALNALEEKNQIVFRYVNEKGNPGGYPFNPNGAQNNIAGICNIKGNILGLMPHPERFIYRWQHPTRQIKGDGTEAGWGLEIFKNAVNYVK
ncbi:MAG: phosphoribosylformylglycinamidine synthase I [Elusimicrobia bacterium]|nr:phosphoribosylformylglycinamidine synthase I [Elusimicrobiota bacterium]